MIVIIRPSYHDVNWSVFLNLYESEKFLSPQGFIICFQTELKSRCFYAYVRRNAQCPAKLRCTVVISVPTDKIALAEENPPIMSATTVMRNDGEVAEETKPRYVDIDSGLLDSAKLGVDEGIAQFLAKPQLVQTYTWGAGSPGSNIGYIIPYPLLASVAMWSNKVANFRYFRGTAVCTVLVNAQKFQAGRLRLVWNPFNQAGLYTTMRYRSLTSLTQLPGVELDASCQTSMVMRVPFVCPLNYYDLQNQSPEMGEFALFVYSTLTTGSGGDSTADIQVFVHWEDVSLYAPIIAQMNQRVKGKNPSDAERSSLTKGSVSSTLNTVAQSLSTVAKIPLLSSVAQPAAWAVSAFSGAAHAFGWSKPYSDSPSDRMIIQPAMYVTNVDGLDNSSTLGLCSSNQITQLPGFAGTDLDEMSFEYLSQISAYVGSVGWSTATTEDTVLYQSPADISIFQVSHNVGATVWFDYIPAAFIAQQFVYWKSSIRVTIKVVKTSFHSGRLMFWYNPNVNTSTITSTVPTVSNSGMILREFLDVRENSEWTFDIPYTCAYPMCHTADSTTMASFQETGIFGLSVVNRLRGPESVAQNVDILIEISACPDFEVYVPKKSQTRQSVLAFPQMNEQVNESCDVVADHAIANSTVISKSDLTNQQFCVGENVQSFRQLIKRFSRMSVPSTPGGTTATTTITGPTTATQSLTFNPYSFGQYSVKGDFTAIYTPGFTNDYLSLIAGMYVMNRGSVQLKFVTNTSAETLTTGYLPYVTIDNGVTIPYVMTIGATGFNNDRGAIVFAQPLPYGQTGTMTEVHVPAYQRCHSRFNVLAAVNPDGTTTAQYPQSVNTTVIRYYSNDSSYGSVYRAAGDDFSFGFFVGVPPVIRGDY